MRWPLLALLPLAACKPAITPGVTTPTDCNACHAAQVKQLTDSHHGRAQTRTISIPDGEIGGFTITHNTVTWHSPDGGTRTAPAQVLIGVSPLKQLAVEITPRRWQVPPIGLDEDGGWRTVPQGPGDWTTSWPYDWAKSCAPCHATGFVVAKQKSKSFTVTCEACHGDVSGHLTWLAAGGRSMSHSGFPTSLASARTFTLADAGTATPEGPLERDLQSEVCGGCHSRRRALDDDGGVGGTLLDDFEPTLLDPGVFDANGGLRDETFEASSFLQSRMAQAGVRCTDCHDPHTATLRRPGNALCGGCHALTTFEALEHRRAADATCVSCHMPTVTFLGIDQRHDHFIRRTPASTEDTSSLRRATSLTQLDFDVPDAGAALAQLSDAVKSEDPWLRYGAATALTRVPPRERSFLGFPLLTDSRRAIRVRAARALTGVVQLPKSVVEELERAELANGFRGEAWLNLGSLAHARGQLDVAQKHWRHGLEVDPHFVPLTINLADLLRETRRDAEGIALLEQAVISDGSGPWEADLFYALGLAHWRAGRKEEAAVELASAAKSGDVRHLRASCLAEKEVKGAPAGAACLEKALRLHPGSALLLREGSPPR
ncbi:MAG: cytochrome c3 family protein [Myxococcaceae bacterium]